MSDDAVKHGARVAAGGRAVLDRIFVVDRVVLFSGRVVVEPGAALLRVVGRHDLLEQAVRWAQRWAVADLQAGHGDVTLAIPVDLDRGFLACALDLPLPMQFLHSSVFAPIFLLAPILGNGGGGRNGGGDD